MITTRRLGADAAAASHRLGQEAFGVPAAASGPDPLDLPGWHWWGAEEGGRLLAQAADREFDGWFGARVLPVAGIAGVTVAAEARGRGVLAPVLLALLEGARERGAVVSTLFPSAPGIYRRTGFESIATVRVVDVPSAALAALRVRGGVGLRRAEPSDAERVRRLYDSWAAGVEGALTRRGVSFTAADAELVGRSTGLTLAEAADGRLLGYASWDRGRGDGSGPELVVQDLLATDVDAYAALLGMLGSFASVARSVRLRTTADDLARLLLGPLDWSVVEDGLYMLKVLDVEAAFTGARCAPGLDAELGFTLAGDVLPGLDGAYVVSASAGSLRCVRGRARDDRTLSPRGLALLLTGARPCRDLRVLGLLVGGDPAEDATWDALVAGRVRGVLDHF